MAQLIDASGVVVFEGEIVDGGSQPFKVVRTPIAFDTPDLTFPAAGLTIYTPTPGDMIIGGWLSIPAVAWDGTSPALNVGPAGDLGHYLNATTLSAVNSPTFSGDSTTPVALMDAGSGIPFGFADLYGTTPTVALIDDGAGGDPGSIQGEGEIVLLIVPAAA